MTVQIVRTLVYTYADADTAERDMALWTCPATGIRRTGTSVIHSASTPMRSFQDAAEAAGSAPALRTDSVKKDKAAGR